MSKKIVFYDFILYFCKVNYLLMKMDKEVKKAFSKKRGPLTVIISGGGGGPLQIVPFLLDKIFFYLNLSFKKKT